MRISDWSSDVCSSDLFFVLLALLPVASAALASQGLALFDSFYRAGALVFGGGHVVLPLLETEVVRSGWVGKDAFLAGYGAAQAVPRSEEHTSEIQSLMRISYAVFCLNKKKDSILCSTVH